MFFVFADVLSMRGVGGGPTNLPILSSLSQRYIQTVSPIGALSFFVSPSFLYLQISAKFLEFLKSFSDFPVSYRLDNSKTVEIRNIFFTQTPSCPT